jgi:outer membrane receptor protein involved in Fe transport
LDEIKINLLYRGIGKHFWNDENTAFQDYYGLLDLKVSFNRENLGLDFWVNNLLNSDYLAYYFVSGSQFYQKGKPMRFGANLSLKF